MQPMQNGIRSFGAVIVGAAIVLSSVATAFAQLPQTKLYAFFPAGAKAGSTVSVQVNNGGDIDELSRMIFNHPGIRATPSAPGVFNNNFLVSVDDSVPPGIYEARVSGRFGTSNPRAFQVGRRTEANEAEPNNDFDKATALAVGSTMNAMLNGATDVDVFKFSGKKGQRLLARCDSVKLDSRLDAVVEIFDNNKRRLTRAQGTMHRGPVADVTLPEDGDYFVRVVDFTFRGSVDYVYRLTVHADPHVDFIWPPAGLAGTRTKFSVYGRNLTGGTNTNWKLDGKTLQKVDVDITLPATQDAPALARLNSRSTTIDGFWYSFQNAPPQLIQFASSAVATETEPREQPQTISAPGEVSGFFSAKGEIDTYAFQAQQGQVFYIEAFAQRMGSEADPYFLVEQITKDASGKETAKRLTAQDDIGTNPGGNDFYMANGDAVFRFQALATGEYRVKIRDRYFEARGNRSLMYRLAIRKPEPDFRIVAMAAIPPMANNQPYTTGDLVLRKGQNAHVRVLVHRKDGFNQPIEIRADGLPAGTNCPPIVIGPTASTGQLVFTTSDTCDTGFFPIKISGRATVENADTQAKLTAAQTALTPVEAQHAKVQQSVAAASAAQQAADAALKQAAEALKAKPDDENLKKTLADKQTAATNAAAATTKANADLTASTEAVARATAAIGTAIEAHRLATKTITRLARIGSVTWAGNNNLASTSGLVSQFGLSIIDELKHFQPVHDLHEITVHQGTQVLIPVRLLKRQGFDNNVAFTFVGQPKNCDVQNKPIAKGKADEVFRMFVKSNAPEGVWTMYLNGAGQVSYARNPEQVTRAEQELATVVAQLTTATNTEKSTNAQLVAATKAIADATAKQKTLVAEKAKTEQADKDAKAKMVTAMQQQVSAAAGLKSAQTAVTAVKASREAARAAGADITKDVQATLDKAVAAAMAAEKQALQTRKDADTALAAAQAAIKASATKLADINKQTVANDAALKTATANKTTADAALKKAQADKKAAEDKKKAVDAKVAAAKKAAAPKNVNVQTPTPPIVVRIRKAPVKLTAAVPSGGALKRGAKIDIACKVKRQNGFAGPVRLTLAFPPGTKGLTAPDVEIPADKTDGTISVTAAADAPEGALANLVIRSVMSFNGNASVDAPIGITVQ